MHAGFDADRHAAADAFERIRARSGDDVDLERSVAAVHDSAMAGHEAAGATVERAGDALDRDVSRGSRRRITGGNHLHHAGGFQPAAELLVEAEAAGLRAVAEIEPRFHFHLQDEGSGGDRHDGFRGWGRRTIAANLPSAHRNPDNAQMSDSLQDWLAHLQRQHPTAIELGLERVREVAVRMQLAKPASCVITVGGTNGKGSTVAFIEAIARAAGLHVGAYTSPHLLRYNERVRIDGVDAGDADLVAAFEAIEVARGDISLTYFEVGTLAALWLFARAELDLAILEVGLGGRLDAVNIVDPDVAVITTVDLDHMDWLGEDREDIGVEKAGIARAWKPLVLGDDEPPSSVLRRAYAIGASALRMGCDFFVDRMTEGDGWQWREPGFILDLPLPALAAPVQLRNAAVAIAALRASPLEIPDAAWAQGIAAARLPGRLQRLDCAGVEYRLDVGHNPQAAQALADWLQGQSKQGRVHAVFAALADKDVAGVTAALASHIDHWHLAGLDVEGRAQDVDALAARVNLPGATRHADVAAALEHVRSIAVAGDRVLVFGSFHTVEASLHALHSADCREAGSPAPV